MASQWEMKKGILGILVPGVRVEESMMRCLFTGLWVYRQTGFLATISTQGLTDLPTTHIVGDPNTGCSKSYNAILAPVIPEMMY